MVFLQVEVFENKAAVLEKIVANGMYIHIIVNGKRQCDRVWHLHNTQTKQCWHIKYDDTQDLWVVFSEDEKIKQKVYFAVSTVLPQIGIKSVVVKNKVTNAKTCYYHTKYLHKHADIVSLVGSMLKYNVV